MDIWIAIHERNADRVLDSLKQFGFDLPNLSKSLFLEANKMIRFGQQPMRIELLTGISGVNFEQCFDERIVDNIDGIMVNIISLNNLKENKQASGRFKDLDDLEHLP